MKQIYFAGGCFWGVEAYFKLLKGVIDTDSGYIDGNKANPTYEEVVRGVATHAEAVKVVYDENIISLEQLLDHFFRIIDPFALNRQGHDFGIQYRSGVYYDDDNERDFIINFIENKFSYDYNKVKTVVMKNLDFSLAENYHQDYLTKNPGAYCHVNLNLAKKEERN
jgi:peptide-methionine (S)-S-oxide reductase